MSSYFFTRVQLENLYLRKNLSTYKIADKKGCNPKTVFYWLQKYNIPTRPKKCVVIARTELENLYINERLSLKEIGRRYHINPSAIFRKMVSLNIKMRTSWETNIVHKRTSFSGNKQEKAYLIGFRIGDLNVTYNSSSIIIKSNTTQLVQVNLMKQLFSKYGPVWISSPKKRSNVFHCTINLNKSFSFLIPKPKAIPCWILASGSYFWAFVAGYTDAEGTIRIYSKRARVRIGSYDKTILRQIHTHLTQQNIKNTFRLETKADGIRQNGDFYRVNIMDKNALQVCLKKLLPLLKHARRRFDARLALKNVMERI